MSRIAIPALVLLAACASSHPREFNLTAEGFRTDGATWRLDPIQGTDKMMPEGWEREPSEVKHESVVEMKFTRVQLDGEAVLVSWKLDRDDERKSLRALSERELTAFRLGAGTLLFGTVEPAKAVLLDGAEAQEGTYEMRRPGDYAPVTRVYASFAKSIDNGSFLSIFYFSPPGQFDDGLASVQDLTRRIHFPDGKRAR